jgi:hypothetical protein
MNQPERPQTPEPPNPERRSDAALLCLCIGVGLLVLSWLLGVGAAMTTVLGGASPAAVAGGVGALVALLLALGAGIVLCLIGGVWLFVRVIADQREDHAKERYSREVER